MTATLAQCAPTPATVDREEIEATAERMRARLIDLHHRSMESLLRSMGIAVREQPACAEPTPGRPGIRLVLLPDGTGEYRRPPLAGCEAANEMMAEAVAHATLHAKRGACTIFEAYPQEDDEAGARVFTQALWFRDALLMPRDAFGAPDADPERLAVAHGVSERSARRRIARLRRTAATA